MWLPKKQKEKTKQNKKVIENAHYFVVFGCCLMYRVVAERYASDDVCYRTFRKVKMVEYMHWKASELTIFSKRKWNGLLLKF